MGRAMIQMASFFGRALAGLERVSAQGGNLGRPTQVSPKIENAIKTHLSAGKGILKVATLVGVGRGTVQRVKREMVKTLARAACPSLRPLRRIAGLTGSGWPSEP
jgi:DNA invertase Pin-like site-specific DNA recombinase